MTRCLFRKSRSSFRHGFLAWLQGDPRRQTGGVIAVRSTRRGEFGTVKVVLVVGALAASVLGTDLVAQKEAAVPSRDTSSITVITIPAGNREEWLELPPVPTAISPALRPVARSRSSR